MIDWKELFPAEAIAPFIGGLVLWFGFNYVFFAPQVIAPRLAERYYYPACETAVAEHSSNFAAEWQKRLEEQERDVQARADKARAAIQEELNRTQGSEQFEALWGLMNGNAQVNAAIAKVAGEIEDNYARQNKEELRDIANKSIHKTKDAYCNCVIGNVLDNRFDLASYTSSLRFYTPPGIARLESGQAIFDTPACGAAPVV